MSYKKLSETELKNFAGRLNEVCDDMGLSEKFKGRQIELSKIINTITGEKITPNAARKWIEGEGYPSTDKMIHIARWSGVSAEWFLSGAGEKKPVNVLAGSVNTTLYKIVKEAEGLSDRKKSQVLKIIRILSDERD